MVVSAFERIVLVKLEELKQSCSEVRRTQTMIMCKLDHLMRTIDASLSQNELSTNICFHINSVHQLYEVDRRTEDESVMQLNYSTCLPYGNIKI